MTAIIVQIGNSDDKLTQQGWSHFYDCVDEYIHLHASQVHFSGLSDPKAKWQNAAWVFECSSPYDSNSIREFLIRVAKAFKQDSIAWTEGTTEFLTP